MIGRRASSAVLVAALTACSGAPIQQPSRPSPPPALAPTVVASTPSAAPIEPTPEEKQRLAEIDAMLKRVSQARGLPIKHPVVGKVLSREKIGAKIREHVEGDEPLEAIEYEGEALAAMGLVPNDYDFVEGAYKLLGGRIAGFYEPLDQTMYLVDDLDEDEAKETLAHELVHALQDQSFPLEPTVKYVPGDGDRISAAHSLIEGDATSASLDITFGSAFAISENQLRLVLLASTELSKVGGETPRVLLESLIAPYADGFAFVQDRRRRGGFAAVDAAFKRLPATTEQLLHPEKYDADEPKIPIAIPPVAALGAGFKAVIDDEMGEQGLRIILAEWSDHATSVRGAAGWGGDRYVVARKDDGPNAHDVAFAWLTRFDTEADAREVAAILEKAFGKACKERTALGPLVWRAKHRDVAVAAGPFRREGKKTSSASSCALTTSWADAVLASAPK